MSRAFLFLLFLSVAQAISPPAAVAGKSFHCLGKEVRTEQVQLEREAHWDKKIQAIYQKAVAENFAIDRFWGYDSEKTLPECQYPYELARRLAQGDKHPATLLALGFTKEVDQFGNAAVVPPKNYSTLLTKAKELGLDENGYRLVFVFIRKNLRELTENLNDYVVVEKGVDPWPSPDEFKLIWQHPDAQLPPGIWYPLMGSGKFVFPGGNFLDHELAHLTEKLEFPKLKQATRDYYRKYANHSELHADPPLDPELKRLADRAFYAFEFFTFGDFRKSSEIKERIPHLFDRAGRGLKITVDAERGRLSKLTDENLMTQAERVINEIEKIIVRQGGGMRDSYNFEYKNSPSRRVGTGLAISYRTRQTEDPYGYETIRSSPGADESLMGMGTEIKLLLEMLRSPEDLKQEYSQHANSYGERFVGSIESFRKAIRDQIADRLARLEVALYMSVELKLTGEQVIQDMLVPKPDPQSKTHRYLDSFLPESNSKLREAFLGSAPK